MQSRMMITKALCAAMLLSLAMPSVGHAGDPKKDRKAMENFLAADKNEDGLLDRREFKKVIELNAKFRIANAENIRRTKKFNVAFSIIDTDKDGAVSSRELGDAARAAGH